MDVVANHGAAGLASRSVVHVEVVQADRSNLPRSRVESLVDKFVRKTEYINTYLSITTFDDPVMRDHVESVTICQNDEVDSAGIHLPSTDVVYHVFKLNRDGASEEEMQQEGEEDVPVATHWILPSSDLQGIWENLVYDTNIKENLLKFVDATMRLADAGVDQNIISCNKVVLLHGPPGTGKTSLCKALAQKLTVRLSRRYRHGQLIEINSHSLFSKWFSESGKLVQKMFKEIKSVLDDTSALVCVLIDEVESLTAPRKSSMSGAEPSDAVRVVNALLTQIDSIKHLPNVLIFTTSNITGAIDLAFVDRADIKQYVGLPSQSAIYQIYYSCVQELITKKIIQVGDFSLLSLRSLQVCGFCESPSTSVSLALWKVAEGSAGLSGRTLRKIPFHALALFCEVTNPDCPPSLCDYIQGIKMAVEKAHRDNAELSNS